MESSNTLQTKLIARWVTGIDGKLICKWIPIETEKRQTIVISFPEFQKAA